MRGASGDIADFYEQLSMLVKSDLPLPESLRQLARVIPSKCFKAALQEISEAVARGQRFSQAARRHPKIFTPLHLRILEAGEVSGVLPEALFSLARLSRLTYRITTITRETLAYPLLTLNVCLLVLGGILISVMPQFKDIFNDLLEGAPLPALTQFFVGISDTVTAYRIPVGLLYTAFAFGSVWVFLPFRAARRSSLWVADHLPGACRIAHNADSARLCGMWSVLMQQDIPTPDALNTVSLMMDRKPLRTSLAWVADAVRGGGNLEYLLSQRREIDPLIPLTLKNAPEEESVGELRRLGHLFERRVALAMRSARVTWSIVLLMLMTFSVGAVVIAMFVPLIDIITRLSGG